MTTCKFQICNFDKNAKDLVQVHDQKATPFKSLTFIWCSAAHKNSRQTQSAFMFHALGLGMPSATPKEKI